MADICGVKALRECVLLEPAHALLRPSLCRTSRPAPRPPLPPTEDERIIIARRASPHAQAFDPRSRHRRRPHRDRRHSSAQAAYSLIRWEGTGFCQIWDHSIPTQPYPSNYKTVSAQLPTLLDALNAKSGMLAAGTCTF